jgi:hypothetical protein
MAEEDDGGDYYRDDNGGGMGMDDDHAMDEVREGDEVRTRMMYDVCISRCRFIRTT